MKSGCDVIKERLKDAPSKPGIYMMFNDKNEVLYIGKAKNIRNRVENYSRLQGHSYRIATMISHVHDVRFIETNTEKEAIMMENSNIKSLKPRYNALLKDDKSFPEIVFTTDHDFPAIKKHRGKKVENGKYFGPFASSEIAYETISTIKKFFQIRSCSDYDFASRERPCMEYQVKRCSAPCVSLISKEDYNKSLKSAMMFLNGKTADIQESLSKQMYELCEKMEFEKAANIRDKIKLITQAQMRDDIQILPEDNFDLFGFSRIGGSICVQVFFFRGGYHYGNRVYNFDNQDDVSDVDIFDSFFWQFYANQDMPSEVISSVEILNVDMLDDVKFTFNPSGRKAKLIDFANNNAIKSLEQKLKQDKNFISNIEEMKKIFNIPYSIDRIDVFDNSHISGANAIGGMIVVDRNGFNKSQYRKFNFKEKHIDGDDYSMMREVMSRRFAEIKNVIYEISHKNNITIDDGAFDVNKIKSILREKNCENIELIPDVLVIDGGVGHRNTVLEIMKDFDIIIEIICVSKGVYRNAGNEKFHTISETNIEIDKNSSLMYFMQRIRDEVHRFAISSHRQKRSKDTIKSVLDEIPNIGVKRKKALLSHFGSIKLISEASIKDLSSVSGINSEIAGVIYNYFHK
jgi:excinuclease ABC subunit C